ncbi:alpha-1,2-fucosyltransferase [Ferruginibacter paludis]|uniref:alpha-1,2-fucosyltransferase n=1 Tax=Ferruginibacter paludis TaxID=1310417 RepID=UPI0025B49ADC|nr:alpha-1,2-fucosyltransferase [Ferruginibacter paludis]MDN3658332.1 alpha-1,2-fucosyltransferase [Ferruginibacter paludis]
MIVVELQGGLGNQMFQYALGRHLAVLNNAKLHVDTHYLNARRPRKNFTFRTLDLDIFNIEINVAPVPVSKKYGSHKSIFTKIINRCIQPKPLRLIAEKEFNFNPSVLSLSDNVYLTGYWQSEYYFTGIEQIIRKDFVLKLPLPEHIQNLRAEIETANAVCLHVRRGDFVNTTMHGTLGMEYYSEAVRLIKEKILNPVFYIFSDDINWCKKNIVTQGTAVYVDDEFAAEKARGHFSLMTACKHFIIPNSSFGWWAAWLGSYNDKIVIAPKIWFHNSKWDTKDIVPKNWIKI